jgi:hypothetical protein
MAAEITSQRNTTLMRTISDVAGDIADLAAWPNSDATKVTASNSIKLLREELRGMGYPHGILYMAMVQIASSAYLETCNREHVTAQSLKQAWIKIGDILSKD